MVLPERRRQQQSGALAAGDAQEQRLLATRLAVAAAAAWRAAHSDGHVVALGQRRLPERLQPEWRVRAALRAV